MIQEEASSIEDWAEMRVYEATQTPITFKSVLGQLYRNENLQLGEKLDVSVRKVAIDSPVYRVTLVGNMGDIEMFIGFVTEQLGVTFTLVQNGIKMEKTRVQGQFQKLKTVKRYTCSDDCSEEDSDSGSNCSEQERILALRAAHSMLVNNQSLPDKAKYRFLHNATDDQIVRIYLADLDNEQVREYVTVFLEDVGLKMN